jgi:signal transduction histidine kinase/ligand-binding sensor domain-containing protein
MYQDREGFMWFGTDRGVSRYDGTAFITFTVADGLGSNFVRRVFQDEGGTMWFGLIEGGVTAFDGSSFNTYTMKDGLNSDNVLNINQDRSGRMYFKTDRGVSILSGGRFVHSSVGAASPILTRLADGSIVTHDSLSFWQIVPSESLHLEIRRLHIPWPTSAFRNPALHQEAHLLPTGQLCIVSRQGVLIVSHPTSDQPAVHWLMKGKRLVAGAEARDGVLWLAGDLVPELMVVRQTAFSTSTENYAVPVEQISSLLFDREGNLWVGTLGNGVLKLRGNHLRVYDKSSGLPIDHVATVFEDSRGTVWFGSGEGVSLLSKDRLISNIRPLRWLRDTLLHHQFRNARAFAENARRQLYIGTFSALIGPSSTNELLAQQTVPYRMIGWGVSSLFIEEHGTTDEAIWVATYGNGTHRFRGGDSTTFRRHQGIVSDMIEAIVPGNQSIWFLSRNHGASRFKSGRFESFSRAHGLPSDAIYSLYEETDGTVWFGTDRGLVRWKNGTSEVFGNDQGLFGTVVLGIIPHRLTSSSLNVDEDALWVITDKMLHSIKGGQIARYGSSPILPKDDASINQVFHVRGTPRVWLATTRGAVELDLSKVRRADLPPPAVITEVVADTTVILDIRHSPTRLREDVHPAELPYYLDDLNIRFTAPSYSHQPSVRYRYRLVGTDESWSAPTSEVTVRYRQLTPGAYRFEVVALNPDGLSSPQPAVFSFVVLEPFWQRTWFHVLIGIVATSLLGAAFRYVETRRYRQRIAQLEREEALAKEREQTRARIARDLHDDLSSTLGSIALYGESLKRRLKRASRQDKELLHKISTMSTGALEAFGDVIWSVAPRHDTLSSLLDRLRDVLADACTLQRMDYAVELPRVNDEIHVSDHVRRNLYLIFKEAINNVVKHSQATTVKLTGTLQDGMLELLLEDNGVGLNAGKRQVERRPKTKTVSTGHGLQNMKSRADEVGAELSVTSSPKGTVVCLRIRMA